MTNRADERQLPDLEALGLSGIAVPGKSTYHAVQLLLAGRPISAPQIVKETGVARTGIPRLLKALEGRGAQFERETVPGSKVVTYRLLKLPEQHPAAGDSGIDMSVLGTATVTLRRIAVNGTSLVIELDTPVGTVSGRAQEITAALNQPGGARLSNVLLNTGGSQTWIIGEDDQQMFLTEVTWLKE